MRKSELVVGDYHTFYQTYIDTLGDDELIDVHQRQFQNFPKFIESIPDEKLGYAYDRGKWTVAEVLLHVIDTERIFQYRALRFSRGDKTPLPGFEQDDYVPNSLANRRSKESLIEEYKAVRKSTIALFTSLDRPTLEIKGVASNAEMSVAAMGFIISGHQKHHRNILRERYL
ncbi:DinB family protein [Aurantibacter crassamenti]|uniref:DinB family protein n=1 Tax=Aurantibacter crassamenti TaxID=1837375 RepID=UPI001939F3CD|nr:DinB family protein [Aurantibacter crassamenti]MBM1106973.1 DinB family protein [Aurantibacter crassamenti]